MNCAAGRPRLKGQDAQRAVSILYAFILGEEREVVKGENGAFCFSKRTFHREIKMNQRAEQNCSIKTS